MSVWNRNAAAVGKAVDASGRGASDYRSDGVGAWPWRRRIDAFAGSMGLVDRDGHSDLVECVFQRQRGGVVLAARKGAAPSPIGGIVGTSRRCDVGKPRSIVIGDSVLESADQHDLFRDRSDPGRTPGSQPQ